MRTTSTDTTACWGRIRIERTRKVASLRHGLQEFMSFFPAHDDTIHDSVKTGTVSTLDSKKVPCSTMIMLLTIVALNVDYTT